MPIHEWQCDFCYTIDEELLSISDVYDYWYPCKHCSNGKMNPIISHTTWKWGDGQWRGSAEDRLKEMKKNGWKKEE